MRGDKKNRLIRQRRMTACTAESEPGQPGILLSRLKRMVLPAVVFLWPFVYFFRHIIPINGTYTALINDFISLYYRYKVYLLDCLANFHFPLWSPSEAAGFPFYTNPFAQAFYPLNILLVLWYKILGGYIPLDHQLFTVFGIAIFALGLFMWLRKINTNTRAVLFAVLVMSVSFRMAEIMRFPNAVHTAAWYPWVLYAITAVMHSRTLKSAAGYGSLLVLFLICLWTGSYPYYVYYCQFLFVPYSLIFVIKPLRARLIGTQPINWKLALTTLIIAGVVWIVICGPHIIGVKHLMMQTTDRAGKSFAYSTDHEFTFEDTLGSLMYPPAAMEDGWNFFSVTGLLIVLLYMVRGGTIAAETEEEGKITPAGWDLPVKLCFIIWIGTITYITYGKHSYLFRLLWEYMPGFSALRIWARFNITLVPILAWLLSLAYASFESSISHIAAVGKQPKVLSLIIALAAVYAAVLATQVYFYANNIYDPYWPEYFKHLTPQRTKFIIYGTVGFVAVCTVVLLCGRIRTCSDRFLTMILLAMLAVVVLELRPVGTHVWTSQGTFQQNRQRLNVTLANEASFRFPRIDNSFTIALGPVFSAGIIENWYFSRYVKFLREHQNEPEALKVLLGVTDGRRVFFSESIKHPTIISFLTDGNRYLNTGHLLSYTGDEFNWQVDAPVEGYLSFIDNWDRGWKAYVDDKPAETELLFGTFKAVRVSPGRHYVRFRYQPGIL